MLFSDQSSHVHVGHIADLLTLAIIVALSAAHDASNGRDPTDLVFSLLTAVLVSHFDLCFSFRMLFELLMVVKEAVPVN